MQTLQSTDADTLELERRIEQGSAVAAMSKTQGWAILKANFEEQLEAYKNQLLLGCSSWDQYQEIRGKAFAIRLLMTDLEDFIRQGEDAVAEVKANKSIV